MIARAWAWIYREAVWYHAKFWLFRHSRPKPTWEPIGGAKITALTIDEMRVQDCVEKRVYWGNHPTVEFVIRNQQDVDNMMNTDWRPAPFTGTHQLDDAYATDIPACSPVYEGRTSDPDSELD